ncbi:MAG: hypothetical protein HYY37_03975 [Candidatus Aenigmarchaeota archaeon]|nr:hypothetical protein [Candidatus Aenigmarchaeota archaeon]
MATTIQISEKLKEKLNSRKLYDSESYEDVLWDILEDSMELSEETKREIAQAQKELSEGKGKALRQVRKELGL